MTGAPRDPKLDWKCFILTLVDYFERYYQYEFCEYFFSGLLGTPKVDCRSFLLTYCLYTHILKRICCSGFNVSGDKVPADRYLLFFWFINTFLVGAFVLIFSAVWNKGNKSQNSFYFVWCLNQVFFDILVNVIFSEFYLSTSQLNVE